MLEVQNLTKQYGALYAVQDLSFSIKKGEVVGLLGRNGAGKTTTLRMLTCILNPTSGTAVLDGFDMTKHPDEIRFRTGYLPDSPPIYADMTVQEYLRFVAGIKKVPATAIKSRIEEVMTLLNLIDRRHQIIHQLSYGFKQRVGIAQALVNKPPFLVFDEPTSGLDPIQVKEFRQLISTLKAHHTILYSSHNLLEVYQNCDRILIVDKGKLIAKESLANLASMMQQITQADVIVQGNKSDIEKVVASFGSILQITTLQEKNQIYRSIIHLNSVEDGLHSLYKKFLKADLNLYQVILPELTLDHYFTKTVEKGGL